MQTATIQARLKDGRLHIQGAGPEVNRDYGVALDYKIEDEITEWLATQSPILPSLAGSEAMYLPGTARITEDEDLELTLDGHELNIEDGAAMTVLGDELLRAFVEACNGHD